MAEKSNKQLLLEAWKERGNVEFNETFKKISDMEFEIFKHTVKKMEGGLTQTHYGVDLGIFRFA